ncbi:uncharacterized protein LOC122509235 [Leptopilina heterotoma]|uniref:uncharacterized protein LOC122509235 n=1 Tax=Leptopilina heterotoma TaxID=63436 RepID=UPI001CA9290B|nr:uncharacterized protein LOC122509235 [Leptopilina heterotoma]
MIRRQYNSALRIKGILFPISQRTLSTANVRYVEQKNIYSGILSKIKKIFHQPEIRFREVELLPICCSKHKKHSRTKNRPLRKILANYSMENNLLRNNNNNNSYLKYIRIDKLLSEYMLAQSMRKKKMGLVSLGPVRGIMGLASYTSKPPITEPNMPPQQEKSEEKKRKKPVIKADGKTTQELENDLLGLEPENYRYQWGVKLIETPVQEASTETSTQEAVTSKYILQNSWGVKVKKILDNDELKTGIKEGKDFNHEISKVVANEIVEPKELPEIKAELIKNITEPENLKVEDNIEKISAEELFESKILQAKDKENETEAEVPKNECVNNDQTKLNSSLPAPEDTTSDSDYNVPKGLPQNAEIIAWQDLVDRSKPPVDEALEAKEGTVGPMFIPPEPPAPKLDVEAVKPIKEEKFDFRAIHRKSPSTDYASTKRIHTDSHLAVSTTVDSENPVKSYLVLNSEKTTTVKENLVDPFMITKNAEGLMKTKENLKKMSSTRMGPRLPTKVLTLTRINTDDMSYYNALDAKKVEETYGRMVEIELSSPSEISKNILDAPLPTEITISMKPSSEKRVDTMSWIKCARSSSTSSSAFNSSGNFFGSSSNGSSGSSGRKKSTYLASSDTSKGTDRKPAVKSTEDEESDDEVENYAPEGNYVRVPGDPYPYSREHFYKWRVSRNSDYPINSLANSSRKHTDYREIYNSAGDYSSDGYRTSKKYNNVGYGSSLDGYDTAIYSGSSTPKSYNSYNTANYDYQEYSNATYAEKSDSGDYDNVFQEDSYNDAIHNNYDNAKKYTATTEYSSHETEDQDEIEDDQGDYYTKTSIKEAKDLELEDGPIDTTSNIQQMNQSIHRSLKNKNFGTSEIAKHDINKSLALSRNVDSNLDLFQNRNRSSGKSRNLKEDSSEVGEQAGQDVSKVFGQQNQSLCRQLSTIEKDDGCEFERMQFYKGQGLFHTRLSDLRGQVVITSLDQHFQQFLKSNSRLKNFEKINELQC